MGVGVRRKQAGSKEEEEKREETQEMREEVQDEGVRHGGSGRGLSEDEGGRNQGDVEAKLRWQGATNVTVGRAVDLDIEPANRGRLKRPRISQTAMDPPGTKPDLREEEDAGSGGVKVEAVDEVEAGVKEETSLGDSEVSAEGTNSILKSNLAPKTSTKKKEMGSMGGGDKPRGKKGSRSNSLGNTEKQWDPGSR